MVDVSELEREGLLAFKGVAAEIPLFQVTD
jgi:hypothetical protein